MDATATYRRYVRRCAFCNLNVDFSSARHIGHKSRKIYPAISPGVEAKKSMDSAMSAYRDFAFYHADWKQASYIADSGARVHVYVFVGERLAR